MYKYKKTPIFVNIFILLFSFYLIVSLFIVGPYNSSNTQNFHILENSWSPDGRKFLFRAESKGSYIFDVQKLDYWKFSYDQSGFDWSAKGDYLIYINRAGGSLYIVNIKDKEKRELFNCPIYCAAPQFSPDQSNIVFRSYYDYTKDEQEVNYYGFDIKLEEFDRSLFPKPTWYELGTSHVENQVLIEEYSDRFAKITRIIESPDKNFVAIENDGNIYIISRGENKTVFILDEKTFYRIFPFQFKSMQGLILLLLALCLEFLIIGQKIKKFLKHRSSL